MQIDLRRLEKADDRGTGMAYHQSSCQNIDQKKNDRPYLALVVLTHPDKDHIQGFAELLKKVDIGEIWPPGGSTLPAAKPPRRATEQSGGSAWR